MRSYDLCYFLIKNLEVKKVVGVAEVVGEGRVLGGQERLVRRDLSPVRRIINLTIKQ